MKHQQYTNAVDNRSNKLMSIEEIAIASDFNELRFNLKCPTDGCEAKLKFINGKTGNYLRTFPHSIHSKDCPYAKTKKVIGTKTRGTVLAGLSQEQVTTRLESLLKEAFPRQNTKKNTVNKKVRHYKTINKRKGNSTSMTVKYSSSAAPLPGESKHTPHIPHLHPNQIGIGSEGSIFKGFGLVKLFKKESDSKTKIPHYKVVIHNPGNNVTLTLLIRDSYFRRLPQKTLDGGMTDFIMDYSKKHSLMIAFIATVIDGEKRIGEIKTDYDVKVFSNKFNNRGKAYTFAEFYSIVTH